jgi:hypothetical protein
LLPAGCGDRILQRQAEVAELKLFPLHAWVLSPLG